MPSYVTVNVDSEEKSLQIWNLCLKHLKEKSGSGSGSGANRCKQVHEFMINAPMVDHLRSCIILDYNILLYRSKD